MLFTLLSIALAENAFLDVQIIQKSSQVFQFNGYDTEVLPALIIRGDISEIKALPIPVQQRLESLGAVHID